MSTVLIKDNYEKFGLKPIYSNYLTTQLRSIGQPNMTLLLNIEGAITNTAFAGETGDGLRRLIIISPYGDMSQEQWANMTAEMNQQQLERFGVNSLMQELVFVGISLSAERSESKLYSSSIPVLRWLLSEGRLENTADDIERIANRMRTGLVKAVKESDDGVPVYRLDVTGVKDNVPIYKAFVPNGVFKLSENFLLPLQALIDACQFFGETVLQKNITKVTYNHTNGKVTQFLVTTSIPYVAEAYSEISEANKKLLTDQLNNFENDYTVDCVNKGAEARTSYFDVFKLRLKCIDLNASVFSPIVKHLRMECIDMLVKGTQEDVNTSVHEINHDLACDAFCSKVKRMNADTLEKINFYPLDGYSTVRDKKEALLTWGIKTDNQFNLYSLMTANEEAFGDVKKTMENIKRSKRKFLKDFKPVELTGDSRSMIKQVLKLLNEGTIRLTMQAKTGGVYERVCTSNTDILEVVYGANWRGDYESPRTRIKYLQEKIQSGEITNENLNKELTKLDIGQYVDLALLRSVKTADGKFAILENALIVLKSERSYTPNPDMITARSLEARVAREFYVSFDINLVQKVEYAPFIQNNNDK